MKLVDKLKIAEDKSKERAKEVQEGVKLAKSVDLLRETYASEQEKLRLFRDSTLKAIKGELDGLIEKKNSLNSEIKRLNEERIKAQSPIDLTTEWKRVEIAKNELESLKQQLFDRETNVMTREIAVHDLDKRKKDLDERDIQSSTYLSESTKTYEKTEELRRQMEERKLKSDSEVNLIEETLKKKEQSLVSREYEIVKIQEQVAKDKNEILQKGTNLIERESILESEKRSIAEREIELKEMEALTKQYNDEASRNYDISENLKIQVENEKRESDLDISERYKELSIKEQDFGYKQRDFILEKESVQNQMKEIEKEKIHINSQQQTLKVAWENLKKLSANK